MNICIFSTVIHKTVPDNNASAKMAFLYPLKTQFRKKIMYITNERVHNIATFVFSVSHQTGEEMFYHIFVFFNTCSLDEYENATLALA